MGIRGIGRFRAGVALIGMVALLALPVGAGTAAAAPESEQLHPQTRANLWTAIAGESLGYAMNRAFAVQASAERLAQIRRLYDRGALDERQHVNEQAKLLGLVRDNANNLRAAIDGAAKAARTYRRFAAEAKADGDTAAARLFSEIAMDKADHRDRFKEALNALQNPAIGDRVSTDVAVRSTLISAGAPKVRSQRTLNNLRTATRDEALAFMMNVLYADHAQSTGRPSLATLLRRIALVGLTEHFAKEANLAGLVGRTKANLCTTIAGERYEGQQLYPRFAWQADRVDDLDAAELFAETADDELRQARAFQQALADLGGECSGKK